MPAVLARCNCMQKVAERGGGFQKPQRSDGRSRRGLACCGVVMGSPFSPRSVPYTVELRPLFRKPRPGEAATKREDSGVAPWPRPGLSPTKRMLCIRRASGYLHPNMSEVRAGELREGGCGRQKSPRGGQ